MSKIIFFSKSVSITGGKEKMLLNLANHLAGRGYLIEIITYDGSVKSIFPINNKFTINTLSLSFLNYTYENNLKKLWHFLKDVKAYKKLKHDIKPSDKIVVTDQIIAAVAFFAFKKKCSNFIVWEHISYFTYQGSIWNYIISRLYPKLKAVVALSKEEATYFRNIGCNTICLPNAITPGKKDGIVKGGHTFVWVGSLTIEKGVDDIIEIGKMMRREALCKELLVFGGGPCQGYLKDLIDANGLQNFIVLQGVVKDISVIYTNALALIVTSKHECFPTVILEAFSYAIPVIAYDCPTGPRNLITHNKDGFLVTMGDAEQLFYYMKQLINDTELVVKMGANAFTTSSNYSPDVIYPLWEKIFN